jgi:DNA-binding transcriptional regulator LsrR (DeoR family)
MDVVYCAPKNGSEIANELGVTRQSVSNILKKAMKKIYIQARKMEPHSSPFEVSCSLLSLLNVGHTSEEVKSFYNLFPVDIRNEIEKDALENHVSKTFREKIENDKK